MGGWKYPVLQNIGGPYKILCKPWSLMGYSLPEGFVTDLASVPSIVKWYADDDDDLQAAAILHDWVYDKGNCTRREADGLFYEAMVYTGIRRSKAWICWLAVRVGGRRAWRRHRNEE
jgi:hypothetical protein